MTQQTLIMPILICKIKKMMSEEELNTTTFKVLDKLAEMSLSWSPLSTMTFDPIVHEDEKVANTILEIWRNYSTQVFFFSAQSFQLFKKIILPSFCIHLRDQHTHSLLT